MPKLLMANSNIYLETVFIQERRRHLGKPNSIFLLAVTFWRIWQTSPTWSQYISVSCCPEISSTLRRKARFSGFLTCQLVQSLHKMKSLFASVLVFAFCIFVGKFYMCPDIQLLYFDLGYFNTDNSSWVIQYHYVLTIVRQPTIIFSLYSSP